MIYIDTSVVLAQLLIEHRKPATSFWSEPLISSRLTEYETWTRINARGLQQSHGDATRDLLERLSFIEMSPLVMGRALDPFPVQVRTLDAIHLSSIEYLRSRRIELTLATFDRRMAAAAEALGVRLATIE